MLLSAPLLSATKPLRCPMQLSSSGSRTSEGLLHEFCFMFLNTCVVHESSSTNSGKCFSDNKPNDCLRKGRSSWSPKWVLKANQAVVGCCASLMYVCVCIYTYRFVVAVVVGVWRLHRFLVVFHLSEGNAKDKGVPELEAWTTSEIPVFPLCFLVVVCLVFCALCHYVVAFRVRYCCFRFVLCLCLSLFSPVYVGLCSGCFRKSATS